MDNVHYSNKRDDWETPPDLFRMLNAEFDFKIDVCASETNAKCELWWDKADNALKQCWGIHGICWCNPPYGRQIGKWVKKAYETSQTSPTTVVMLLPARTDTKWFHDYCMKANEIRFIRGRLRFVGADNAAPFPSCVVVFRSALEPKGQNTAVCVGVDTRGVRL